MAEERRKDWRGVAGAMLLVAGVIERVLGLGGSIDFIITRSQNPGWVGVVANGLIQNIGVILILAGLVWLFGTSGDVRRGSSKTA